MSMVYSATLGDSKRGMLVTWVSRLVLDQSRQASHIQWTRRESDGPSSFTPSIGPALFRILMRLRAGCADNILHMRSRVVDVVTVKLLCAINAYHLGPPAGICQVLLCLALIRFSPTACQVHLGVYKSPCFTWLSRYRSSCSKRTRLEPHTTHTTDTSTGTNYTPTGLT